jgi:hypothetical protein
MGSVSVAALLGQDIGLSMHPYDAAEMVDW